uniref:Uncharacterized protein n=1 Tax=Rhizobium rhizogenes TaxID=359 RepID=A0A7S4ZSM1_RHIRH|nr:hypothetical protein pC5.7c_506 [Rhizobium rhizogenes]
MPSSSINGYIDSMQLSSGRTLTIRTRTCVHSPSEDRGIPRRYQLSLWEK